MTQASGESRHYNVNGAAPAQGPSEDPAEPVLRLILPGPARRLDAALAEAVPEHSRARLKLWIEEGRLRLDGQTVTQPRQPVAGGERVELRPAPSAAELAARPEDMELPLVHEDAAILVINKPAGLVVHPGSGNWSGTLLNGLLAHRRSLAGIPRAGIVHRLDRDTSGLMVVAASLAAQTDLVRQLQARTVSRRYLALVQGLVPEDGRMDAPIGRHPRVRVRMAVVAGGKPARTDYRVLRHFCNCRPALSLLECRLHTGRTHQIRVHMASLGYPLLGDPTYGGASRLEGPSGTMTVARQMLHAGQLGLLHPETHQAVAWTSQPPPDLTGLLSWLEQHHD